MIHRIYLFVGLILAFTISLSASLIITGLPVTGQIETGVTVSPNLTNSYAKYKISCYLPTGGNGITISFPAGTDIRAVDTEDITVDTFRIPYALIDPTNNTITIGGSGGYPRLVEIAQIRNPVTPGSYTLTVGTSSPMFDETVSYTYAIVAPNNTPVADRISVSTTVNTPLTIKLTGTDADSDMLTFSILEMPRHGTLGDLNGDTVIYTPETGFIGRDYFPFYVSDGTDNSESVLVNILITEPTTTETTTEIPETTPQTVTTTTTQEPPPATTNPISISPSTTETTPEPTMVTTVTTITPTTSSGGGLFSSCSTNNSGAPSSSMTDGFVLTGFGITLAGGYFVVKSRRKK